MTTTNNWRPAGTNAIEYSPQINQYEQIREQFSKTKKVFLSTIDENNWGFDPQTVTQAIDHEESASLYQRSLPVVARFIGTELDTVTPGIRGVGRVGQHPPRLGGKFRSKLQSADAQNAIGAKIESILIAGFAGAIGVYSGLSSGPPEPVNLETDALWERWVPQAIYGLRSGGNAAAELTKPERSAFRQEAKSLGLLSAVSLRKRASIAMIELFYASAGAALYEYQTDLPDRT